MIYYLKNLLYAFVFSLLLASCASESTYQVEDFGFSLTLPAGWKAGKDTYGDRLTVELSTDGLRMLQITQAKPKVDNLEMLVKASQQAGYEVLNQEKTEGGFGVTLKVEGVKQFAYYFNKGEEQYRFEPAPYYKESGFEECMQIIKSVK